MEEPSRPMVCVFSQFGVASTSHGGMDVAETTWSTKDIYETWGLFRDYGVAWCSESRGKAT